MIVVREDADMHAEPWPHLAHSTWSWLAARTWWVRARRGKSDFMPGQIREQRPTTDNIRMNNSLPAHSHVFDYYYPSTLCT